MSVAITALLFQQPMVLSLEGSRNGIGRGRHIVFLAGDEEYRSEEGLPQLARILSKRHGFRCTVVFSTNEQGQISPDTQNHQPGIEALDAADLCILQLRFRHWPDAQMRHFVNYVHSGKPLVALRTSTHAFDYPVDSDSLFARCGWNRKDWPGGFGKQLLGETWVSHWGDHGSQATRGVVETVNQSHPILRGVEKVFGTTDVYEAHPPGSATVLMRGAVLQGMSPDSPMASGIKRTVDGFSQDLNQPMMPILWLMPGAQRVVTYTMGAATDLLNEGVRRVIINSSLYCLSLESKITPKLDVRLVGDYRPSAFGFGGYIKGRRVKELAQ